MERQRRRRLPLKLLLPLWVFLTLGPAAGAPAEQVPKTGPAWTGPVGQPLPFTSTEEVEDFLLRADVVSIEDVGSGVTQPWKVLLERDGIQAHAVFRYVDFFRKRWRSENGLRKNFRDSFRYERAAFLLARQLGMENVPPVVLRRIEGKNGSLQLWVEQSMTELERKDQGLEPPDPGLWQRHYQMMYLFDNLIYNDDRHYGNILIDPDWNFWLIDATRSFLTLPELKTPTLVRVCSRALWKRLQEVTDDEIRKNLRGCLEKREIEPLLERRRLLVDLIRQQISERGEEGILFDD